MLCFGSNIKLLRKQKNVSQEVMAVALGIKRSTLSSYEIGTAEPSLTTLQNISNYFDVPLDTILNQDLSQQEEATWNWRTVVSGKQMRVLPITVGADNEENIELVPVRASAGYLSGYTDPEFIASLPHFRLPMLPPGTYRAFEVEGDSMYPILPGAVVVAEYILDWNDIRDGNTYILVTQQEGIVFKRVYNRLNATGSLELHSDNQAYQPYSIQVGEVLEVWRTKAVISLETPVTYKVLSELTEMVKQLQSDVESLKASHEKP